MLLFQSFFFFCSGFSESPRCYLHRLPVEEIGRGKTKKSNLVVTPLSEPGRLVLYVQKDQSVRGELLLVFLSPNAATTVNEKDERFSP